MAEIADELLTAEQKEERAKELFNSGSRNYHVKDYSEAAEDLSRACELYAELFGNESEEIGLPYLYYAKTLIALAQRGENKVLALDENAEEDEDDGDEGAEAGNGDEDDSSDNDEEKEATPAENGGKINEGSSSVDPNDDPQPGTSSGKTNGSAEEHNGTAENGAANEDDDDITNLQCAWESLEMAVRIFDRMGDCALPNLADAHFELGEISLENGHYAEAIVDYGEIIWHGTYIQVQYFQCY